MATAAAGRRDSDSGRFYTVDGRDYPSVTTILDALSKPALIEWAATVERNEALEAAGDLWDSLAALDARRVPRLTYVEGIKRRLGAGRAWKRERDRARRIGTEMHDLIQWHLATMVGAPIAQPTTGPEAVVGYQAFARWLDESRYQPVWVEFQVWSERHGYAGTLDTAGNVGEVACVGDWKSSKRIYAEAVMQVSAYIEALREMGHLPAEAGPVWGFVLRLPKREGDQAAIRWISPEQQQAALQAFLALLATWRWLRDAEAAPDTPAPTARSLEPFDPFARIEEAEAPPAPREDYRLDLVRRGWWICTGCDVANGPGWACKCGARPNAEARAAS